ncbi:pentapeptide repeat-containing protein [Halosimplex aquaticum]|uniref:Pentapeptide repeat-containing protein n=1 Tax=Halosimplex aquaticum TaxID=3026162 RepID=A0ABD5Y3C9_9EURY|nr:pentapeptide repeat-containing protein [Halosimplex aquaticum]
METATDGRCGYSLEVGLSDVSVPAGECDRPAWDDNDRCVWHATVDGKSAETLEEFRPEPGESLDGAYLRDASLVGVDWLAEASLVGADFSGAVVNGADLGGADLTLANMKDLAAIDADFTGATLEGAVFTNADLRRATLEHVLTNEAVFTDVHVGAGTRFSDISAYEREPVKPTLSDDHPLEAAAWTYRQLQRIYQDNALPGLARESYTQEKDARRRLAWSEGDYLTAAKWELSRWVMHYGSSPYRVLLAALLSIVVSAALFPITGGIMEIQGERAITYTIEDPSSAPVWWIGRVFFKSLYFSVVTFATLGYGDIQPIGAWARFLAGTLSIVGSLLSALLVFVLARLVTW